MKSLEISIQDMLILELLEWFKESFFTWVNSPSCDFCSAETKFSHMTHDKKYCQYTNRVEVTVATVLWMPKLICVQFSCIGAHHVISLPLLPDTKT